MKTNLRAALFYMFLAGFSIANAIACIISNFPPSSYITLGSIGIILLSVSIWFYRKFSKEFEYVLHPNKTGWKS